MDFAGSVCVTSIKTASNYIHLIQCNCDVLIVWDLINYWVINDNCKNKVLSAVCM